MLNDKDFWLFNKPIAHRGLWGQDIIENSLPAYQNAVDHNFPIEIDLYTSLDGHLVSFHDKNLFRMTGENSLVYEKTLKEIKKLKLLNSNYTIPTFNEVLDLVDGKVPLLIEIKNQPNKKIVELVVERLKNYNGQFAIQSFNPFYINKVKKLAPNFIRGILGNHLAKEEKPFTRSVVKNLSFNFLCKPHFISYNYLGFPLKKRVKKNLPVIAWTITDKDTYKSIKPKVNNIIFENFIP